MWLHIGKIGKYTHFLPRSIHWQQLVTECQLPCSGHYVSMCYCLRSSSKVRFLRDKICFRISQLLHKVTFWGKVSQFVLLYISFSKMAIFQKLTIFARCQFLQNAIVLQDITVLQDFSNFYSLWKYHKFCKTSQFLLYITVFYNMLQLLQYVGQFFINQRSQFQSYFQYVCRCYS